MKSQMHAQCAVPITPDQMRLAGRSLLSPHADDAVAAARRSFEPDDSSRDGRWSARSTLLFILASNAALWWMIACALHAAV